MHGCLAAAGVCLRVAAEEVVPAGFYSPKSPLEDTAMTESAAEARVGVRSFPAALLLPLLSNTVAIRNPGPDLEVFGGRVVVKKPSEPLRRFKPICP